MQSLWRQRSQQAAVVAALSAGGGLLGAIRLTDVLLEEGLGSALGGSFAGPVLAVLYAFAFSTPSARTNRDPTTVVKEILDSLHPELGVRGVAQGTLKELRRLSGAREIVVVLEEVPTGRLLVIRSAGSESTGVEVEHLPSSARGTYLFSWRTDTDDRETGELPGDSTLGIKVVEALPQFAPPSFQAAHPCARLYAVRFRRRGEWQGRVFLLDPAHRHDQRTFVANVQMMLQHLLPPLAAVCDVHDMRRLAAAQERARLGRELHDGVVQGLLAIEIQLDLIRRRAPQDGAGVKEQLAELQGRLRSEVTGLRTLLQQTRGSDLEGAQLPGVLDDIVGRFERESGIAATYVSDVCDLRLPARVCGEIVRILQEALVNVQRHSGAHHVTVRFAGNPDRFELCIEDDGRGFVGKTAGPAPATARAVRPPVVIHERAKSIGGSVRVAPAARGARLEITLPRRGPWTSSTLFGS
jgi:signal transduction histidine kinase